MRRGLGRAEGRPPTPRPTLFRVDIRAVRVERGAPAPPLPPLPRPRLVKFDVRQIGVAAEAPQIGGRAPVPRPRLFDVGIREARVGA